jgi:hypothetical protein
VRRHDAVHRRNVDLSTLFESEEVLQRPLSASLEEWPVLAATPIYKDLLYIGGRAANDGMGNVVAIVEDDCRPGGEGHWMTRRE